MATKDHNAAAAAQLESVHHALSRAAIALQSAYAISEELQDALDTASMAVALVGLQLQSLVRS